MYTPAGLQIPAKASILKERIALVGFGAQGEAEAVNLRRSGIEFKLGLREGPSFRKAKDAGFQPMPIERAVEDATTIFLNLPDQIQAHVFQTSIKPFAKNLKRLVFAHGFNTHFQLIPVDEEGPAHVLIAPKGAARGLTEYYGTATALPAILAILPEDRDTSEERDLVASLALALGAHPRALIWARFKDETECDLFSEQALLCGGITSLLRKTYEVMIEAGYHQEAAYYESLFELKLIVDMIWKEGITGMRSRISPTARFGDITRGDRIIDETVKARMKEVLKEIQSGKFAKEFLEFADSASVKELEEKQKKHPLETEGVRLRERMKI